MRYQCEQCGTCYLTMAKAGPCCRPVTEDGASYRLVTKYLAFYREFVEPILAGEKRLTIRLGLDRPIVRGDEVLMIDDRGVPFARAEVLLDARMTVEGIARFDFSPQHGTTYDSADDLIGALSGIYAERQVEPDTLAHVIGFDVTEDLQQ